jgi:hypothetical protein
LKREQWYVANRRINSSSGAIDGIRMADKFVQPGVIIPGDWFKLVNDQVFDDLFVNGYEAITVYQPTAEELPVLYTLYPATRPKMVKAAERGGIDLKNKWYRVATHDGMVYGIAALCTIEGVCKAGDVAYAGDVIPAAFLAGLSIENISRLERSGAVSMAWVNGQTPDLQAQYMAKLQPQLVRLAPNPIELQNLYAKYPGANPNAKPAIVSEDGE